MEDCECYGEEVQPYRKTDYKPLYITYKNGVNVRFYNNYTCSFIVVICFVYMGDNTNYLISLLFNKTENVMYIKMYMSFY